MLDRLTAKSVSPPSPLVAFTERPLTWLRNKLWLLVTALAFTYFGMLMAVAVYYLLTQVYQPANDAWHGLVPNDHLRHAIRNVGEGFMGGLLGQQIIWNHYRRSRYKPLNWLDRQEIRWGIANIRDSKPLSVRQLLASPFVALLYAVPGFTLAYLTAYAIRHNAEVLPSLATLLNVDDSAPATSALNSLTSLVTNDWEEKLAGLGAAFMFGRRPVKGVFDDMQSVFALRRVMARKPPPRYYPPTFTARFRELQELAVIQEVDVKRYGAFVTRLMSAAVIVGILLALYGAYILIFIANG